MGYPFLFLMVVLAQIPRSMAQESGASAPYEPQQDYSRFMGRVTDKNREENILKVETEAGNARLLKTGDMVEFRPQYLGIPGGLCRGFVRDTEEKHIVFSVEALSLCSKKEYFRRGTLLSFFSPVLPRRVRDAVTLRARLLERREDFYNQLNDINHFIWSYDQQKVLARTGYERQIADLRRRMARSLNALISKKNDYIRLRGELARRLDAMDKDLAFYALNAPSRQKEFWEYDHESNLPVLKGPPAEDSSQEALDLKGRDLEHSVKLPF